MADGLGLKPSAPSMWVQRGCIPAEHHVAVWAMAIKAGLDWQPPGADALLGALRVRLGEDARPPQAA